MAIEESFSGSSALLQAQSVDVTPLASLSDSLKWQNKQFARSKDGRHSNKSHHVASGWDTPGIGQPHVSRLPFPNPIGEHPEWVGQLAQSALRRRASRSSIGQRAVMSRPMGSGADLAPSLRGGGPCPPPFPRRPRAVAMFISDCRREFYDVIVSQVRAAMGERMGSPRASRRRAGLSLLRPLPAELRRLPPPHGAGVVPGRPWLCRRLRRSGRPGAAGLWGVWCRVSWAAGLGKGRGSCAVRGT